MWKYHTSVRPRRKRVDGERGNEEYKEEFLKSYQKLFEMCTTIYDINDLKDLINSEGGVFKYNMITEGDLDEIDTTSNYHVKFTKSKFLSNPKFRRALIDYYNPNGIYIKGPQQSQDDDNKWVIDFMLRKSG